jgi:hypothetical protein
MQVHAPASETIDGAASTASALRPRPHRCRGAPGRHFIVGAIINAVLEGRDALTIGDADALFAPTLVLSLLLTMPPINSVAAAAAVTPTTIKTKAAAAAAAAGSGLLVHGSLPF